MLVLQDVVAGYTGAAVLRSVSLEVRRGEVVALIGANGAGKTTTLRCITQLLKSKSGSISLDGRELTALPPHRIASLGLVLVPEGRRLFPRMSVQENLELGSWTDRRRKADRMREVFVLFPRLEERRGQLASTLSGGEQQMLAIGRALMANPTLLLLDEPSLGLAPMVVRDIFRTLSTAREGGLTILLVEQNANLALRVADRGYVMQAGQIVEAGTSEELKRSPLVTEAYLGKLGDRVQGGRNAQGSS